MGNFKSHIIDDKKEEGEISSDDDDSDIQGNNIAESSHNDHTSGVYIHKTIFVACDTGTQSTASDERENHGSWETSQKGLKRPSYVLCDCQSEPVSKYSKIYSPGLETLNLDDEMNYASSSRNERITFHTRQEVVTREVWETNHHHSLEKVSRRNTVHDDIRTMSSNQSTTATKGSSCSSISTSWSSYVEEFQLSGYEMLSDRRKPSTMAEFQHPVLRIQVEDPSLKEVAREAKKRQFFELMEENNRSNHDSLHDYRVRDQKKEMLHKSRHLVTRWMQYNDDYDAYNKSLRQVSRDRHTPTVSNKNTHTQTIHNNNGHSTSQPCPRAITVPPPTTARQSRTRGAKVSDIIGQKLRSLRNDKRKRTSFSEPTERTCNRYNPKRTHFSDRRMAHNTRNVHTGFKTTPYPVAGKTSTRHLNNHALQTGLRESYPNAYYSESAESAVIRYTSTRTHFSDGRVAHNTRNMHTVLKTTTPNPVSGGTSTRHLNNHALQNGLHESYPKVSFSESAESTGIICTPKRTNFSDGRTAHNTRNTHTRIKTTTSNPVSGETSTRHLNGSMMQENLTKTKADRNLQEKERWKKILYNLTRETQQLRERRYTEIENNFNVFSNPHEPTTILHTRYKIVRTSKVKPHSEFKTSSRTAVTYVSAQNVNLCNDTLEQKEQMNKLDSGLPQIDGDTTADFNLASSLSESQIKFTEPQEEATPNETNRHHIYLSPLNMVETYRDKQASTKGITATHVESHVMSLAETQEEEVCNKQAYALENSKTRYGSHVTSLAQTQEKEACNKQASALENIKKRDEGHVMSPDADDNIQASAKEITETHDEDHVNSPAYTWEGEACNNHVSVMEITEIHKDHVMSPAAELHEACTTQAKEITESHDGDNGMSSAADSNKPTFAKEITETHDEGRVMSSTETLEREACNNHISAMEINEIYMGHMLSSAADGNKQDSAKEITETHNENNMISPAVAQETCNKQASATESTEIHGVSFAADLYEACTTQAKEITESHDEGNVMSSAADSNKQASAKENTGTQSENVMIPAETHEEEACSKQALESIGTHHEGPVVNSAAETQEVCNTQDSAMEITETRENHVMVPGEAHKEAACNKHVSVLVINETYDQNRVMSSAANIQEFGHKQEYAMEITEAQYENEVVSCAETQEDCNKQDSAKEITETHHDDHVMDPAEIQDACNKHVSAMEIPETQEHVMSSAAVGNKQDSANEVSETHNESLVINLEEKQDEGASNKNCYALVMNETDNETYVMSTAADKLEDGHKEDSAVEIIEKHNGKHVMNPAETQDGGACNKQASVTESIKTDNESGVMNCAADLQEVYNKNVSAKEITGIYNESRVMSFALVVEADSSSTSLRKGAVTCEATRTARAVKKRLDRKTTARDPPPGTSSILCPHCLRTFRAKIGLISHLRTHGSKLSSPLDEMNVHHHT